MAGLGPELGEFVAVIVGLALATLGPDPQINTQLAPVASRVTWEAGSVCLRRPQTALDPGHATLPTLALQGLGCGNKSGGSTSGYLGRIQFEGKRQGNPPRGSGRQCIASDISSLFKGEYDDRLRVQFYAPVGRYPCSGVHARLDSTVNGLRGR